MFLTRRHLRGVLLAAAALAGAGPAAAQGGYLTPPAPIPAILNAQPTPGVLVGRDRRTLALLAREGLPTIAEMAEPELRLAGYRISPRTNGVSASRAAHATGLTFQDLATGTTRAVRLPAGARISSTAWSPDGRTLAFVNTTPAGLELWVAPVAGGEARRVTDVKLNGTMGTPYEWMPNGSGFLIARVPAGRGAAPRASEVPTGPIVQENLGRSAPVRTYQDLLANSTDEALFEYYFTSQLATVPLAGGVPRNLGTPALYAGFDLSPSGQYLLVTRVKRPYSYVVPAFNFPQDISVLDASTGRLVKQIADVPLTDNLPSSFDAVRPGPRSVQWRSDAPATLAWAEAQDGGDPRRESAVRDRVFLQAAPFTAAPVRLADLDQRFGGIWWGRDDLAVVASRWVNTRREKRIVVNPSSPSAAPRTISDRSYENRYADPGSPLFTTTATGAPVMMFTADGRGVYLTSAGASERGDYPFLDVMDIATGQSRRLWRSEDPYYESVVTVLNPEGTQLLTRRESATEAPNYYVRSLSGGAPRAVTRFADPAPQLAGIQRQLITYNRPDGVKLSGTLYLPPNYDQRRDGPLPLLMWAYPTEFRDAAAASQVTDSPNRFSRPGGISHLFLLLAGYAILDNPTMPIVGEGQTEPNDTYVEQLVASAKAAVDKVVEMGVADRDKIAVGGHSYGAFMTANLLAHSDLFRAGIARSGAYNRTLTPFGFQAEQRTYWEATDTYTRMSPFTYANRINEPILLIHGANDDNSGTFPIQSERFYAALKGQGATVRYVVLPLEAHGYRARESTMHTLAEMINWLDRYVKNAGPRPAAPAPAATR
ncbi:MAG TPA: prolyl oligopeptidase family serine peptidase [Longimicrobium sp.]|jgi:dipeptidyl aminopeptidase/acylaminoacyl peptidase|uniref:S9 family peptidase n=1 Tax=Longimicrobium sp. TaxID=2029185 RepID=UPI002EDB53B8